MNKIRKKGDHIIIGILLGVLIPIITAYFAFSNFYTGEEGFIEGLKALTLLPPFMSKFVVVCLIPNIMLVYVSYRMELWSTYKGILVCTIFYIIPTVYFFA